jgi:hypothetical protein
MSNITIICYDRFYNTYYNLSFETNVVSILYERHLETQKHKNSYN